MSLLQIEVDAAWNKRNHTRYSTFTQETYAGSQLQSLLSQHSQLAQQLKHENKNIPDRYIEGRNSKKSMTKNKCERLINSTNIHELNNGLKQWLPPFF